jgi:hypothetical protein
MITHRAWLSGRSIGKGLSKELLQRRKAVLEALLLELANR